MLLFGRVRVSASFIFFNIVVIFLSLLNRKLNTFFLYFWLWGLIVFEIIDIIFLIVQLLQRNKIRLARTAPDSVTEDDLANVEFTVKNVSPLPVYNICIEDSLGAVSKEKTKKFFLSSIPKKGSRNLTYDIQCAKRGKYILGPIKIYFFDILGMLSFSRRSPVYSTLYVYPRTFAVPTFPPLTKGNLPWFGVETRRVSGDEDEFFGTREYRQGDPIRRIHWLSTARKGQLIVKEFQSFSFYKATVVFVLNKEENEGQGKESVAEYTVRIASSVSKYLLKNNISLEIVAHAGKMFHLPANRGIQYLDETMKFFASVKPESRVRIGELAREFSPAVASDSTLIVITTDKSLDDLSQFLFLGSYNIAIIPILILSSTFREDAIAEDKPMYLQRVSFAAFEKTGLSPFLVSKGDNLERLFSP